MEEIELLAPGVDLNHPEKGRYYQNVYRKNGALTVRPGFGTLAQFDSTMARTDDNYTSGHTKCLGTYAMRTNFEHIQLISIHLNTCYTSDSDLGGSWSEIYSVDIYDTTTDERWEEVIHRHTSERSKDVLNINEWHGAEESYQGKNYAGWQLADGKEFFFEEVFDVLFFGSKALGLHMYIPADFNGNRRKQINTTTTNDASEPYSESSVVLPVAPADGAFSAAYRYLNESEFTSFVDVASLGGRLILAQAHVIYFSDIGRPASFMAPNITPIPSASAITAIESVADSLLIFTDSETFLYQLNTGDIVSAGRLMRLSENIGCLGPNAISRSNNFVVWCDQNGVYISTGTTDIKKVSDQIQPFFDDRVSNPLTMISKTGNIANLQPRSNFDSNDMTGVSMAYDHVTGCTLMAVPSQNIIWVLQEGSWYLWNLEAVDRGSDVLAINNIPNIKVSAISGNIYLHAGVEHYTHPLAAKTASFHILQLGRGGALDRSVHSSEDNRKGAGYYTIVYDNPGPPITPRSRRFYIGEPYGNEYPVYIVADQIALADTVQNLNLQFTYDNAAYTLSPTMKLPTEIDSASITLTLTPPNAARIIYAPAKSGITRGKKNILCWLQFTPIAEAKSLGISLVSATYTDTSSGSVPADLYWWTASNMTQLHSDNDVVQSVDWVLKSGQLGAKDGGQIKIRTLYAKMKTHGDSSVNIQFASDWTDYKGQSADTIPTTTNDASRAHEEFGIASTSLWNNNLLVDEEAYDTIASSLSVKGEHVSVMMHGTVTNPSERVTIDSAKVTYKLSGGRRRKGR